MATSDDAELGDFFNEINQIDTEVVQEDEILPPPKYSMPISISTVVASKPAQIREDLIKPSHPVYTYDEPQYNSTGQDSSSSNSHYDTSYFPSINNYAASSISARSPTLPPGPAPSISASSATSFHTEKTFVRKAADEVWVDDTLQEWPENDFRVFVGDLAKDVTTDMLTKHFSIYPSFARAKVVRNKSDNKSKGYGFVSLLSAADCLKVLKEQQGKYLGSRPMKLRRSTWKDREIDEVKKKETKKRKVQEALGLV